MLILRRAVATDAATIAAINEAGRPGVFGLTARKVWTLVAQAPYLIVAECDDHVLGYTIGYTPITPCDGDEFAWFQERLVRFLYIDQIAVAPEARRGGIGTQLYTHAQCTARAQQLPALVCEVNLNPPNPISLQFHRRLGFREVGRLNTADGRHVSLLQLDINTVAVARVSQDGINEETPNRDKSGNPRHN